MLPQFQNLIFDHDLRFVALAAGICALGSLTCTAIARHALKPELVQAKRRWLLLAGVVTGLVVWTTHFMAMLGYRQDLLIRFDLPVAGLSIFLAMAAATAGWLLGFAARQRAVLGGIVVGCSIAIAHFLDMASLRVPGIVLHDHGTVLLSLIAGISLCAFSGYLFVRFRDFVFAWPAAASLFSAVLSLHFIAMSGVTIIPSDSATMHFAGTASPDDLTAIVVAAFILLLAVAIVFTWHSERLQQATAAEHAQLTKALEDLRRTEDHLRSFVDLTPQIAWVAGPDGGVTEIAPLWEQLVGIPRTQAVGFGWARPVHPDDRTNVLAVWRHVIETGDVEKADVRYRLHLVDGSYKWFRARARPRQDNEGRNIAWYGTLEDIDDQVMAEGALLASEERYRLATRATNDIIWDWSFEEEKASWAGAFKKVLGYPDLNSRTDLDWWLNRIHPEDRGRVLASQNAALESGADYWNEEYRFRVASGEWIDVKTRSVIVRGQHNRPIRLVGSMLDVTEQKRIAAELNWAAYHDALTGLANRTLFQKCMEEAIDAAKAHGTHIGLLCLDLNGFKALNDTLGHAAGDKFLQVFAQRLEESVAAGATVARLGGDEFAIIIPDLQDPGAYFRTTNAISSALVEPAEFDHMRVPISYCAGIAIWPRDGRSSADLMIAADLALYAAKAEMPGTIREFEPSLLEASVRRSRMLSTARKALDENKIVPSYQPKVDLRTGLIIGWEALLRLQQDDVELLPPGKIAAAFADAELSVKLTDRMLDCIFADLAKWGAAGVKPGRMAINVSAHDFRLKGLADRLQSVAATYSVPLENIDIEVTEDVLIGQLGPEVSRMLEQLRKLGVMVALDDFGTGFASLTNLQQFPVDVIKIDKSFIDRLDAHDPKATAVVDAVLHMAKQLGMQTVAEGVETREQARYLRARGCDIGQGHLFSSAIPSDGVPEFMGSERFEDWQFRSASG